MPRAVNAGLSLTPPSVPPCVGRRRRRHADRHGPVRRAARDRVVDRRASQASHTSTTTSRWTGRSEVGPPGARRLRATRVRTGANARRRVHCRGSDPHRRSCRHEPVLLTAPIPRRHVRRAARADAPSAGDAVTTPGNGPTVFTKHGAIHGLQVTGGYAFRGLPYAAAADRESALARLRNRQPHGAGSATRRSTRRAARRSQTCSQPPGPQSEDCLYLNVSTPTLRRDAMRPVLVWIHGGGFTQDGALNYDGAKLAANGIVVVTINYRLGALGFLAHPALASRPGGPAGNYGLMDQQEALRWVKHNIAQFGGDPHNVTIAGPVGGRLVGARPPGLARLPRAVPPGDRAERCVRAERRCRSPTPRPSARPSPAQVGCGGPDRRCLRQLPADDPRRDVPRRRHPGRRRRQGAHRVDRDGAGRRAFARVPILNGMNHNEEWIFVAGLGWR